MAWLPLASFLLPLAALTAQTTYIVQGGGAALANAIAAAAPGDHLVVLTGNYTDVVVTRGLRIELQVGARVGTSQSTQPAIAVTGLPAGEAVVVTGGELQGIGATNCAGAVIATGVRFETAFGGRLFAANCTGPIAFHDTTSNVSGPPYFTFFDVSASAQVSFTNCLIGRVWATGSHVALADCTLLPFGAPGSTSATLPTLKLTASHAMIRGGLIHGGVAAGFPPMEYGIQMTQGELTLTGGAIVRSSLSSPLGWLAAIDAQGGLIRVDPTTTFVGSVPIQGTATVITAPIPSVVASHAPGSSSLQVTVAAPPGALAFTLIGWPAPALPTPWGDAWLDPASPVLNLAVMPANGSHTFARTWLGVPLFLYFVVQTASIDTANTIAISPPQRVVWN